MARDGEISIGRVYRISSISTGGWFWTCNGRFGDRNGADSGQVMTLDEACRLVEAAWDRMKTTVRPLQHVADPISSARLGEGSTLFQEALERLRRSDSVERVFMIELVLELDRDCNAPLCIANLLKQIHVNLSKSRSELSPTIDLQSDRQIQNRVIVDA